MLFSFVYWAELVDVISWPHIALTEALMYIRYGTTWVAMCLEMMRDDHCTLKYSLVHFRHFIGVEERVRKIPKSIKAVQYEVQPVASASGEHVLPKALPQR